MPSNLGSGLKTTVFTRPPIRVLTSVGSLFVLLPLLAIATWTARSLDNQVFRLLSFAAASA